MIAGSRNDSELCMFLVTSANASLCLVYCGSTPLAITFKIHIIQPYEKPSSALCRGHCMWFLHTVCVEASKVQEVVLQDKGYIHFAGCKCIKPGLRFVQVYSTPDYS